MKRVPTTKYRALISLFVLSLLPGLVFGADKKKAAPPPPAITKLTWLAGNWRMEKSSRVIDEQWMAPAGGVMLGMTRTLMKGRLQEQGFFQIREGPIGALFYIAQLSGQKEAVYPLSSLTDAAVVFENSGSDFPQKISYTLLPNGSLLVASEGGGADGQIKRIEYSYRKIAP